MTLNGVTTTTITYSDGSTEVNATSSTTPSMSSQGYNAQGVATGVATGAAPIGATSAGAQSTSGVSI
jgi:hypothetical protein